MWAANDTMNSHQTLELIAAFYDLSDGDLNLGLVLKFSWKQILVILLNGNNMLVLSLKYRSVVITEKNNMLCQDSFALSIPGRISVELWGFFLLFSCLSLSPLSPLFFPSLFSISIFSSQASLLSFRYLQEENLLEKFWLCVLLFKYLKHILLKHLGLKKC